MVRQERAGANEGARRNMGTVLVIGVGGLGACLVNEALDRGLQVSVLVRDPAKLEESLGPDTSDRLTQIHVGDGTDPAALDEAMSGVDLVLSGRGADPDMAHQVAAAAVRNDVHKLVWPGGTTNVLADDGQTPNYRMLAHLGSWVQGAYQAHQACIDAIRNSGVDYVIFCPGRMGPSQSGQHRDDVASTVRVNRDAGPAVTYEDAAWVILEAGTTDQWDHELISAVTPGFRP